jgi:hypothetical protein
VYERTTTVCRTTAVEREHTTGYALAQQFDRVQRTCYTILIRLFEITDIS